MSAYQEGALRRSCGEIRTGRRYKGKDVRGTRSFSTDGLKDDIVGCEWRWRYRLWSEVGVVSFHRADSL